MATDSPGVKASIRTSTVDQLLRPPGRLELPERLAMPRPLELPAGKAEVSKTT